ncbi:MAG: PAS domain S-box protein [Geobacteraceae bacterium]|nr:PAS domain S-box protein [Geobacteraceae bacterium]
MNKDSSGMGWKRFSSSKQQDSLEIFARMIALMPTPVYFKDISGRYRVFNSSFETFMGMTTEQLLGKSSHDVLPKQLADHLVVMDNKLLCGSSPRQNFQASYTDIFGKERSVIVNKTILFLEAFQHGIFGVLTDVTELEGTRKALGESQKILRNIFEAIPDLLSVYDHDLRIVESNWHGGYEYVPEELRAQRPHCYDAYYPGQGKPCSSCHVLEVFRTNTSVLSEKYNEQIGYVESHAFPVADDSGKTVMVAEYVRDISARKRAEMALCEASQRLEAIIEASPLPILAMDTEGVVRLWNPAAERVFGWKAQEVLNKPYPLLPDQPDREEQQLFTRLSRGEIFNGDVVTRRRKDGSTLSISRYSAPLRDSSGLVIGTMAVLEDVTDRTRAEAELKASEANYRAIFDSTNDGIFVLDPKHGAIIDVNRKMCEMYGCTREEAVCLEVEHFSSGRIPYTQIFALEYIQKAAVGESQMFEWLARRMDGTLFWVEVNIRKTILGGVIRSLASVRDITERKRAEEAHRESEERFRMIFEQNEDPAMIICPETLEIIDVNSTLIRHYGFTQKRLFNEGPGLFMSQPERDQIKEALAGISESGNVQINQLETHNRKFERIIASFRAKVIKARGVSYAYCTFRDITERLRIKEETKQLQTKLLQTNKMAALGTLSSGIAHEINNPTNFILSNAQMVHDAWKDIDLVLADYARDQGEFVLGGLSFSEAREIMPKLLSGIIEGGQRIRNILAGLREFVRKEKLPPDQKVSINQVLEKSITMLQNQIKNYTCHFHYASDPHDSCVRGSFQQLEQVVVNLLMNALQSLPDRESGVYVSLYRELPENNVVIKVRDQGGGMPPETVKRIFDPFFTTRLDSGGTGLGLSICYSIVKEHHGNIEVESEPGSGTSVYVKIPLMKRPL